MNDTSNLQRPSTPTAESGVNPEIARIIWSRISAAGLVDGAVFVSQCGSVPFLQSAPPQALIMGFESSPALARAAAELNPDVSIHCYPPEKLLSAAGFFSVAMAAVTEPEQLATCLQLLAPGGYAFVLAGTSLMDGDNDLLRREALHCADLVSATRLSLEAAGAAGLTDVLVFRRRAETEALNEMGCGSWKRTVHLLLDGAQVLANRWFAEHPSSLLGTAVAWVDADGVSRLRVRSGTDSIKELEGRLSSDLRVAREAGYGFAPQINMGLLPFLEEQLSPGLHMQPAGSPAHPGQLRISPAGTELEIYTEGSWKRVEVERRGIRAMVAEYRALIGLRETARRLLASVQSPGNSQESENLRESLQAQYSAYLGDYGPINRYVRQASPLPSQPVIDERIRRAEETWRETEGVDPDIAPPAEAIQRWVIAALDAGEMKVRVQLTHFGSDPDLPLLRSLEIFDEETGEGRLAHQWQDISMLAR